jgi:hypothetical protein
MDNLRISLNAYYNRDESMAFLRDILRPLSLSWKNRALIGSLFYRRSIGRGDHFQIVIAVRNLDAVERLEEELRRAIHQHPSSNPDPRRTSNLFFKAFPNNTVQRASYDSCFAPRELAVFASLLEELVATGCSEMLALSAETTYWPGIAVVLSHSVLEGFGMEIPVRTALLRAFIHRFVPADLALGRGKEEVFAATKLLLNEISREYEDNCHQLRAWLNSSASRFTGWSLTTKTLCGQLSSLLQDILQRNNLQMPAQQLTEFLLTAIFLGLIDFLLMEETDALRTAYRLQRFYEANVLTAAAC